MEQMSTLIQRMNPTPPVLPSRSIEGDRSSVQSPFTVHGGIIKGISAQKDCGIATWILGEQVETEVKNRKKGLPWPEGRRTSDLFSGKCGRGGEGEGGGRSEWKTGRSSKRSRDVLGESERSTPGLVNQKTKSVTGWGGKKARSSFEKGQESLLQSKTTLFRRNF